MGWVNTDPTIRHRTPGPLLENLIARVRPPTLLISAGNRERARLQRPLDKAARGPGEHWNRLDARHTDAVRDPPTDYQRRVVAFFGVAMSAAKAS